MSETIQCPLCLGYSDEMKFQEVCGTCVDNAASFDITKIKLAKMVEAARRVRKLLDKGRSLDIYNNGYAWGLLNGALLFCEDAKIESEKAL